MTPENGDGLRPKDEAPCFDPSQFMAALGERLPDNMVDCREALARLDEYLDRELDTLDRDALEFHLRLCDHCTQEFGLRAAAQDVLRAKLCAECCPEQLRAAVKALLRKLDAG